VRDIAGGKSGRNFELCHSRWPDFSRSVGDTFPLTADDALISDNGKYRKAEAVPAAPSRYRVTYYLVFVRLSYILSFRLTVTFSQPPHPRRAANYCFMLLAADYERIREKRNADASIDSRAGFVIFLIKFCCLFLFNACARARVRAYEARVTLLAIGNYVGIIDFAQA